MLIETAWNKYKAAKTSESYGSSDGKKVAIGFLIGFFVLVVLTIILLVYAIKFTLDIGKKRNWSSLVKTLIIISMFIPYIGFFVVLTMFIWGLIDRKRPVVA
jgi:hypothetical protein